MAERQQFADKYVLTGKEPIPEIESHIRDKIEMYHQQNNDTYRQWLLNAAFGRGQQWGVIGARSNVWEAVTPPDGLNYVTDDMITPWKNAMVANLSIGRPAWEAVPNSLAPDATMSARTANDLLDALWDEWRFIEKEIEGNEYLMDFANFLIFIRYNEDEIDGEIITDTDTGEPLLDENDSPLRQAVKVGKISADIRPPHHLGCPLDPRSLDEKEWIFWRQSRALGYFRDKYGKLGENVTPETLQYRGETTLADISRGRDENRFREATANEVLFMQKPNDTAPDGLVIPYVNGHLLEDNREKWRWQFITMTGYPVIHVHGKKNAGEFWARSSMESQIPLQRALNLAVSSEIDNIDNMAHMKWGVPVAANVADIWDNNEIIHYEGSTPPAMLKVESLPAWIPNTKEALKTSIRNIQSWHGASQGGAVQGVRSDLHASNLQERDMIPYTTIDNLKAVGWAKMGDKVLQIYAEKMPEQSMAFVRDGRPIVINNFKASMLDSIKRINVRIINTNMRNPSAVKREITEWYAAGLLVDPITGQPDARKATELLEFALPQSHFERLRVHSNQAYIENIRMYDGEAPIPYPFEDHFIHQRVHGDEMNSPRFRQLLDAAEAGDKDATQIVQLFRGHIEATARLQANAFAQLAPPPEEQNQQTQNKTNKQGTTQRRQPTKAQ